MHNVKNISFMKYRGIYFATSHDKKLVLAFTINDCYVITNVIFIQE